MNGPQPTAPAGRYEGSPPEIYQRYFVPAVGVPSARLVVDAARLRAGGRVLDVACGTGVVARLAAEQVGPAGTVAGVDVNPGMLAVARSTTPEGTDVRWYEGSAEALPLPDASFDAVLCSLGLQFVPDRAAAVREMARVLAPGGRVVVGTPGPTPPTFAVLHEVLAEHVGPEAAGFVEAVFSLHDPDEVQDLLAGAGLRDISVKRTPLPLRLPPPADFLWQYVQGTPLAMAVAGIGEDARAALEEDAVRRWVPYTDGDALAVEVGMLVATAHAERPR